MNKIFAILVALFLSSSAFAHDQFEYRQGPGYRDYNRDSYSDQHRHDGHRSKSIGRELIEVGVGGAIATAAIPIGAAIGERVAQAISGTPPQQTTTRVVYLVPVCDRTPFVRGGLVYANPCDGSGSGPVVIGSVDRR